MNSLSHMLLFLSGNMIVFAWFVVSVHEDLGHNDDINCELDYTTHYEWEGLFLIY